MSEKKKRAKLKYSMLIEWSEADKLYLVALPEWTAINAITQKYFTHAKTYKRAAQKGQEVLDLFIEAHEAGDIPLATPKVASYE